MLGRPSTQPLHTTRWYCGACRPAKPAAASTGGSTGGGAGTGAGASAGTTAGAAAGTTALF